MNITSLGRQCQNVFHFLCIYINILVNLHLEIKHGLPTQLAGWTGGTMSLHPLNNHENRVGIWVGRCMTGSTPGSGAHLGQSAITRLDSQAFTRLLTILWGYTEPLSPTSGASIPPRTFMALNSLSAKYSAVLRIHFTEKKKEELVILAALEGQWGGLSPSLSPFLGSHQVQT